MTPFAWLGLILIAVALDGLLIWAWRRHNQRRLAPTSASAAPPLMPGMALRSRIRWPRLPVQGLADKIKMIPAGAVLPLVLLVAAASQFAFDSGDSGRSWGIILFLAVFPVTWLFAYLESRQPENRIAERPDIDWSPHPAAFFQRATERPWRTFLGTLSLVVMLLCASLARDKDNNFVAAITWLIGVGLFLVACSPNGWRPDLARWKEKSRHHWIELLLIIGILAAGSFVRFYRLELIPIEQDEGHFGLDALRLLEGETLYLFGTERFDSHPAVFPYVQSVSMAVFGKGSVGLRIPSAIVGSLNLLLVFLLARQMFGPILALVAGALFAFIPTHLTFSRIGAYDMIVVQLALAAVLYFLYRGFRSRRAWDYALAGVSFGLGLWLDYNNKSMVLVPMLGVVFIYLIVTKRRYWRSEYLKIALFLVGVAIIMLPVWSTYAHTQQLWQDITRGRFILSQAQIGHMQHVHGTANSLLIVAHQVGRSIFGLNYFGDSSHNAVAGRSPMLDDVTSIFFFIGLAYSVWRWREPRYSILLLCWVVGLQASIWSIDAPAAHRLVAVLIPTCLMAAIGIERTGRTWAKMLHWEHGVYLGIILVLLLGSIAHINLDTYFSPENVQLSWKEMAETGKAMKAWSQGHDIFYLGPPWHYSGGHGSILFCSQGASLLAIDVKDVHTVVPLRKRVTRDIAFIFTPGHFEDLEYIREYYPQGTLREWYDECRGDLYLQAYLVTQEEVNSLVIDEP